MQPETKEFVWSARLSEENKMVKWGGREDGPLEQIVLKMAVLGSGAVEGERNLVEVTTFDSEQNKIKTCICALSLGKNENQQFGDLSLFPPANLALVEGSGPVHIVANHIILEEDEFDDMSDEEEEDLSESEMNEMKEDLRKKLLAKQRNGKGDAPMKSQKQVVEDSGDEMIEIDSDELDDDDEEEEKEVKKSQKAPPKKKQKTAKKKEIDEEDLDEDEEELEEEAPSKKRKLTNGKSAEKKPSLTSPERSGKKPTEQKTPKSQKESKTPKKTPNKVQFTSVDQIKTAIQKYPGGKPRKEDKFCNWVQNTFRVSDTSWVGDLWKWHKKEMGL